MDWRGERRIYGIYNAQVTQTPNENKRLYTLKVSVRCPRSLLEGLGDLILPRQGSTWGFLLMEAFPCCFFLFFLITNPKKFCNPLG